MKMTDDELVAVIEHQERLALGYYTGEIASEQAKALDYYFNRMDSDADGYSQAQSSDVWDVVEGMTPQVLKPFVSSDEVMSFMPEGAEDVEAAEQETDYINYVVTQKNNIFEQLVMWVKTGLLQKNGIIKYWWDKSQKTTSETYEGLTDAQFYMLMQDVEAGKFELEGHNEYEVMTGEMPELMHDVKLKITEDIGQATYCVVPPEEFLIGRDATCPDPKKATFVQHRQTITLSKLREMGYDVDENDVDLTETDAMRSLQAQARYNEEELSYGHDSLDDSMQETLYRETYLNADVDGDGIAELRKVCMVGKRVLMNEETDEIPFCAWTPYIQPFKFYGRCPADEVIEIQDIKTTLVRQNLNNIYTINNNRTFMSDKVNVDDMINNALAGIIRVDKGVEPIGNHVFTAPIQPLGNVIQPQIDYWDSAKENRTGFTRYSQGMDADALNQTATGVRLIQEASNQKLELISRGFAETGLKQLMLGIHKLTKMNASKAETVRLRGKWVEVDPRNWKTRVDMRVSVGLGNSDRQMQMQGVQMLLATQERVAQLGLTKPANVYAAVAKQAEVLGFKDYQKYFSDPSEQEPAPPQDPMTLPENIFKAEELKLKSREIDLKEQEMMMENEDRDRAEKHNMINALFKQVEMEKADSVVNGEIEMKETEQSRTEMIVNAMSMNMVAIQESLAVQNELSQNLMRILVAPKEIILDADGMPIGTKVVMGGA